MANYSEFRYVTTNLYQSGSTTNPIISELPFTNVNFTQQLNSIGTFQGEVLLSGINSTNLNAYEGTVPAKTILWVIYTDPFSYITTPVWSGVIWAREYNSETQKLSITAQEMMSLYQRRRISTTQTFVFEDPAVVARSLLTYTESLSHGNTGLLLGFNTTTYATNRTYYGYEYKSIYQAIKDLSSNFFDFQITPSAATGSLVNTFEIGTPIGRIYDPTSGVASVFQFPGNVTSYRFPEDGQAAANKLYGLGYGANNTKLIATAIDPTKIGTGGTWPLLEDSANYTDIPDVQLLKDTTLGQLNATSYPPTTIEVVIPTYIDPLFGWGYGAYSLGYILGDEVRFDIKDDYFPNGVSFGSTYDPDTGYYDALRIIALSVNPGEDGPSNVTLTLSRQLSAGTVS
jgi:hypothetical protein